jgi:uncharacterized protein (TIGR02594 family)
MPNFIKATYHTKLKVAEFITDDGRHLLRFGGTLPWRINNSGDLVSPAEGSKPAPKKTKNFIGFASVQKSDGKVLHFFIFPDYATGRAELMASLKRKHQDRTIPQIIGVYAPPSHNDTSKYIDDALKKTGIPKDKALKNFSEQELQSLADAIEALEGYHNEKNSRKEVWVPVSRINATDGAHTLPDEELVLLIEGKERTVKSDTLGRFPPIPHGEAPIEVKHRTADGDLKPVGTIQGAQGRQYNLVTRVRRFFGQTAPDESTEAKQSKRQPFTYRVQPGDTLAKIAARFETTVGEIKRDNQRATDKIFAGEELSIYAPPNGMVRPARPMPTPKRPATSASGPAAAKPSTAAASKPVPKNEPPPANEADAAARTKEGSGKPLAVVEALSDRAPWMRFAIEEAKYFKGKEEDEIEKERDYHGDVGTGRKSLSGSSNAWCAAFVNWCLLKAGYPIELPKSYKQRSASKGRANSVAVVHGPDSAEEPDSPNPNFVEITEPIFGAIAMVHKGGPGSHVGFVYARASAQALVILGGNQSDQINFTEFREKFEPAGKKKTKDGKVVAQPARAGLRFFVPAAYVRHPKDLALNDLPSKRAEDLNKDIGIISKAGKEGSTR